MPSDEVQQEEFQQWMQEEGAVVQQAHLTEWQALFALWKQTPRYREKAVEVLAEHIGATLDHEESIQKLLPGEIVDLVLRVAQGDQA